MCQALFKIATAIPLHREKNLKHIELNLTMFAKKIETVFKLRKPGSRDSVLNHYISLPLAFSNLTISLLVFLSKC